MPFDNNLVLRGKGSGGALVDLDQADVAAVSTSVNADGNAVIDLRNTRNKGLTAVLILTEAADSDAYDDEATISIEASDELDRHWKEVARFPRLYAHIAKVYITATTPFVASDVGKVLTESGTTDSGAILFISDGLFTTGINGGYVLAERDVADDTFDDSIGQTETATSGAGIGTKATATELGLSVQMQPGIFTVQFKTNKRYVRVNAGDVEDSLGLVWVLLTNDYDESDKDLS